MVRPAPFDLRRFRRGPSGFLSPSPTAGSDARDAPLLELSLSSKLPIPKPRPRAQRERASPGVRSPSALDNRGRPYSPTDPTPPAPSALRVSHPLGGLLRPRSCRAITRASFGSDGRPDCAPGVPPGPRELARPVKAWQGARARVSSPRLSPIPRRARVRALSSPALRLDLRSRLSDAGDGWRTGAAESRSQDRRRSTRELPTPAGLPEVSGRTRARGRDRFRFQGCPAGFTSVTARHRRPKES